WTIPPLPSASVTKSRTSGTVIFTHAYASGRVASVLLVEDRRRYLGGGRHQPGQRRHDLRHVRVGEGDDGLAGTGLDRGEDLLQPLVEHVRRGAVVRRRRAATQVVSRILTLHQRAGP